MQTTTVDRDGNVVETDTTTNHDRMAFHAAIAATVDYIERSTGKNLDSVYGDREMYDAVRSAAAYAIGAYDTLSGR